MRLSASALSVNVWPRDAPLTPSELCQSAFHLGDEVRVAGRVDQVDGDVVDRERDDGGLDAMDMIAVRISPPWSIGASD
jgi:hypothetical protein